MKTDNKLIYCPKLKNQNLNFQKNIDTLINDLIYFARLEKKRINSERLSNTFKYIISNLVIKPVVKTSLNKNNYNKDEEYRLSDIKMCLLYLEKNNYIKLEKGQYRGLETRIVTTPKILTISNHIYPCFKHDFSLIISKKNDKGVKSRKVLSYWPDELEDRKKIIKKYLAHMSGVRITTNKRFIYDLNLKMVFTTPDFKEGGRIYSAITSLSGEERKSILIDNEPTVELDFISLHLTLLYAKVGRPRPDDSYLIEGYERKYIKTLFLISLNAKNQKSAIRAFIHNFQPGKLNEYILDKEEYIKIKKEEENRAKLALNLILSLHHNIKEYLCSCPANHLMRSDSDLIINIIDQLTSKGIKVLSIHDSIVVPAAYKPEAIKSMTEVFNSLFDLNISSIQLIA